MLMINKEISEIFQNITVLQRESLSFAENSVASVNAWVATLSIMQLGDTSESVLKAICEISELDCSEMLRFDLIQVLHSITESILSSLEKNILNQLKIRTKRHRILKKYFHLQQICIIRILTPFLCLILIR